MSTRVTRESGGGGGGKIIFPQLKSWKPLSRGIADRLASQKVTPCVSVQFHHLERGCLCVCMCLYRCLHISACVYIYTCICACMYVCIYIGVCTCVHLFVCIYVFVHVCIGILTCVCVCIWRPELDTSHLSPLIRTLIFEAGSLSGTESIPVRLSHLASKSQRSFISVSQH